MNCFLPPIAVINHADEWDESASVVKADTLSVISQADELLERARHVSAQMIRLARCRRRRIEHRAYAIGTARAQRELEACRAATISRVVQWLVDEKRLERAMVEAMRVRIGEALAEAMQRWAGECDRATVLARQLIECIAEVGLQEPGQVRAHPSMEPQIVAALQGRAELSKLEFVSDPQIAPGQALITTEWLRLEVCIERHLHQVLDALRGRVVEIYSETEV